jgi:hypothetical protein
MFAHGTTIKAEKLRSESLKDISFYVLCISRLQRALSSFPWQRLVCEILDTSQRFINFDFKIKFFLYTYFVHLSTNLPLSNALLLHLSIFYFIAYWRISLTKFAIACLVQNAVCRLDNSALSVTS